ncbi:MAG: hypothetical protein ACTSP4_11415 [Candidatus Hodarchaeales archaeon]
MKTLNLKKRYTKYEGFSKKQYTITVRISFAAHPSCSSGLFNRSISGSLKLRLETKDWLLMKFREPLYAMVFISLNFPVLYSARKVKLTELLTEELGKGWQKGKYASYKQAICPRCGNITFYSDTNPLPPNCPSCGYHLELDSYQGVTVNDDLIVPPTERPDPVICCENCGIAMIKDERVTTCGRCGSELVRVDSK